MSLDPAVTNPAYVDPRLDSRAATFENPTGARGAGGSTYDGRKGRPNKRIKAGERVTLADIEGPGVVRHIWMTFPPAPPEQLRALLLEVRYDGRDEPSIAVPCTDFFGLPHGRLVELDSALLAVNEGRGLNAYLPLPFRHGIKIDFVNASPEPTILYYQVDYTLQPELPDGLGYLHAAFRRQNPTVQLDDFVIAEGLRGPGRFLGCNVGVRVIDPGEWYGEGEVKVYRDGDDSHPTICGTGLEDYVGTAWGMGAHTATYGGAPLVVGPAGEGDDGMNGQVKAEFVGFYRWHLPDPIMFATDLRVTIQQIGAAMFVAGQEADFEAYQRTNPAAGRGWWLDPYPGFIAHGIAERVDDYCATAYVYCTEPQPVPPVDVAQAVADIERRAYEQPSLFEVRAGIARQAQAEAEANGQAQAQVHLADVDGPS